MHRNSTRAGHYIRYLSLVSAISLLLAVGCADGADDAIETMLDESFQLKVGESAVVLPENVKVTFLAVTSDSRCGKGETCVWAGDGVVQVSVQENGINLGQYEIHANEREGSTASFGDFNIHLISLLPPAVSGRVIQQDEYVAVMRIARGFAGNNGVF